MKKLDKKVRITFFLNKSSFDFIKEISSNCDNDIKTIIEWSVEEYIKKIIEKRAQIDRFYGITPEE